jgi:hypothetical protein
MSAEIIDFDGCEWCVDGLQADGETPCTNCSGAAATIERLTRERDEARIDVRGLDVRLTEVLRERNAAESELAKAREALNWYAEKATAMNRYMNATPPKPDAMVSVATELALDNGRRAALPPKPESGD